jgi:uncharacterized membrane protein YfcA
MSPGTVPLFPYRRNRPDDSPRAARPVPLRYNPAMVDWHLIAVAVPLGLVAGVFGGMLGVGGSVIMIPGLTLFRGENQHLYQAAAMIANIAVAVPAAMRHHRQQAIVPQVLRWMLPAAIVAVLAGVAISNLPVFAGAERGRWLGRILAVFLLWEVVMNVRKLAARRDLEPMEHARITRPRSAGVGAAMGLIGGLLGIGGGAMAVPLQQWFLRLPLRNAIANSAAVMVFSAALGAGFKNATLPTHGQPWHAGLILAACLAPTCALGGRIGASLTHRLPIRHVRMAFIALMLLAAWRMLALPWP